MKILMLSKALVVGVYQRKLEELASIPGVELLVVVPPHWHEARVGVQRLERLHTAGYRLVESPMRFNGHHHVHYYPDLGRIVRHFKPDVFHVDEEPYNFVTLHAALLGRMHHARVVFFSWQNLDRNYPPPFSLFEKINYRLASAAVAGNQEAAEVLRRKKYRGPLEVIPQFGVDPDFYRPLPDPNGEVPVIGFVGRLVPEKGVADLIAAFARMQTRARLQIVGNGSERTRLEMQAANLGVRDRVIFRGAIAAASMPQTYNEFDVLVVPSKTQPNWKEQFGRVIVEAMACGVPVVGSDSGEIPNVIGQTGVIFAEGDIDGLARQLDELLRDDEHRRLLGKRARDRVLRTFTQARIAQRFYDVYCSTLPECRDAKNDRSADEA
ncbi:MAG TPA: glycosyltransferase [Nitrolancea sp.]|nr:glycosyltransferase [Nitrolancea sp.]